jgi:hypothetical protein
LSSGRIQAKFTSGDASLGEFRLKQTTLKPTRHDDTLLWGTPIPLSSRYEEILPIQPLMLGEDYRTI